MNLNHIACIYISLMTFQYSPSSIAMEQSCIIPMQLYVNIDSITEPIAFQLL